VTPSYLFILLSLVLISLYKTGGQFNERLLLWQPSGIFLYSTVIILVCLCCAGEYDIMMIIIFDSLAEQRGNQNGSGQR